MVWQGGLAGTPLESMPRPPVKGEKALSGPPWPMKLRTSSSQEEGAEREFAVITTGFKGENGRVRALRCERYGRPFELEADLVLLAMGFLGPRAEGVVAEAGVELTPRGAVEAATGRCEQGAPPDFPGGAQRAG